MRDDLQPGATIQEAGDNPRTYTSLLDVVPTQPIGALRRARVDEAGRPLALLDPRSGRSVVTFTAIRAGSTLGLDGTARTIIVQRRGDECLARIRTDGDEETTEDTFDCQAANAVTGDHYLIDGESATTVIDLDTAEVSAVGPPISLNTDRPPLLQRAGTGGYAMARLWFDGPAARLADTAVSGGRWGTTVSDRWHHESRGEVTGVTPGQTSAIVTSKVVPLNPWDNPADDDRDLTVLDLTSGRPTARLRVTTAVDSFVGLGDGSFLVALEGGRLVRLGG